MWISIYRSDDGRALAKPMSSHRRQSRVGFLARNDCNELSLVGDVQRVEAKNFARPAHLFAYGDTIFIQGEADTGAAGNLV